MSVAVDFEEINEAKANMDGIYDQPDPRSYFRKLRRLGYAIPGHAKPIFQSLISHRRHKPNDPVCILDLGCSYGVNAALLKHDLTMSELYDHWDDEEIMDNSPQEVAALDRDFFGNLDTSENIEVIGLDQAASAIAFGEETGLLDAGLAVNLENTPLPSRARKAFTKVDLVMSTGCVGYVTEKSFDRIMPVVTQGDAAWMGHFVLRLFPFDAIGDSLSEWGYVTEKLEGRTFVQRQFESDEERDQVLEQLHERGIDPTGQETEGYLLAEFYLSRPSSDHASVDIEKLVPS